MPWLPRLPQAPAHNRPLRQLVAQLPLRALLPLIAAIFFQFAVLGPVTDILDGGRHGTGTMIRNAVASGAMAAGFVFGFSLAGFSSTGGRSGVGPVIVLSAAMDGAASRDRKSKAERPRIRGI
jgi:hypothetical protein